MQPLSFSQRLLKAGFDPNSLPEGDDHLDPVDNEFMQDPYLLRGVTVDKRTIEELVATAKSNKKTTFNHPVTQKPVTFDPNKKIEDQFERNVWVKNALERFVVAKEQAHQARKNAPQPQPAQAAPQPVQPVVLPVPQKTAVAPRVIQYTVAPSCPVVDSDRDEKLLRFMDHLTTEQLEKICMLCGVTYNSALPGGPSPNKVSLFEACLVARGPVGVRECICKPVVRAASILDMFDEIYPTQPPAAQVPAPVASAPAAYSSPPSVPSAPAVNIGHIGGHFYGGAPQVITHMPQSTQVKPSAQPVAISLDAYKLTAGIKECFKRFLNRQSTYVDLMHGLQDWCTQQRRLELIEVLSIPQGVAAGFTEFRKIFRWMEGTIDETSPDRKPLLSEQNISKLVEVFAKTEPDFDGLPAIGKPLPGPERAPDLKKILQAGMAERVELILTAYVEENRWNLRELGVYLSRHITMPQLEAMKEHLKIQPAIAARITNFSQLLGEMPVAEEDITPIVDLLAKTK